MKHWIWACFVCALIGCDAGSPSTDADLGTSPDATVGADGLSTTDASADFADGDSQGADSVDTIAPDGTADGDSFESDGADPDLVGGDADSDGDQDSPPALRDPLVFDAKVEFTDSGWMVPVSPTDDGGVWAAMGRDYEAEFAIDGNMPTAVDLTDEAIVARFGPDLAPVALWPLARTSERGDVSGGAYPAHIETDDTRLLVAGIFAGAVEFGSETWETMVAVPDVAWDGFVVGFDPADGSVQPLLHLHSRAVGASSWITSLVAHESGEFTVAGSTDDIATLAGEPFLDAPGSFVARFDATGGLLWSHLVDAPNVLRGAEVSGDGVVVRVAFEDAFELGGAAFDAPASPGEAVIRLDANGAADWSVRFECEGALSARGAIDPTTSSHWFPIRVGTCADAFAESNPTLQTPNGSYLLRIEPSGAYTVLDLDPGFDLEEGAFAPLFDDHDILWTHVVATPDPIGATIEPTWGPALTLAGSADQSRVHHLFAGYDPETGELAFAHHFADGGGYIYDVVPTSDDGFVVVDSDVRDGRILEPGSSDAFERVERGTDGQDATLVKLR